MKRYLLAVCISVFVFGCQSEPAPDRPQRTQRERDSIIGSSRLPGARGVRGALAASDSIAARNARLDSMQR